MRKEMAQQKIVGGDDGVESVEMIVKSVADGVAAGRLTERTSLALNLLHQAAKSEFVPEGVSTTEPVNFFSSLPTDDYERGSVLVTFMFRCACGRRFYGPWEEGRNEAIGHVELRHADKQLKKDLDALEAVIAALIVPNPLNSFEQLRAQGDERISNGTWEDDSKEEG
jgi:hypothetical protein